MSVVQPANPRDVQDFQFKLLSRLRVFTAQDGTFTSAVNLVATASKYGLIFVGCPTGIQVITSSSIIGLEYPSGGPGGEIINYARREIPLPSQPSHLNVSCDQNYLVVAIKRDGCPHALIYNIPSFAAKDIVLVTEVRLASKSDTLVLELVWNPGITNILAACISDGSMVAYELKPSGVDISTLPPATQANCFCWSPKGKQLVVGSDGGTLTQYKPDLKAVKILSPPHLGSGSVAVVNVLWLSNYQFAALYRDKVNTEERPGLLIVNAPKTGPITFVNYEDICYSGGDLRAPQFYLIHQSAWNILMMASANSMEVGVLGLQEDQISWEQWTQEDAARAELPLSVDKQETFPVGFGLDTSTQHELPWGENQSIPPMPVLYVLSHQGVLCLFYAINLRPNTACLCSPPEKLPDESGLALFTTIPTEQSHVKNILPEVPVAADSQHSAGAGSVKTVDQSLDFSTPLHSGATLTSLVGSVGETQVPLMQKFEAGGTSQPSSSLGFGTTLSRVSSGGFQDGLGTAPSTSFGTNPAGALSASFGTGVTVTPTSGFGASLTGTSFAGFGASPGIFGTAISNPSVTGLSHTPTSSFGTGLLNPASSVFGTVHGTAPSVSFGTGPLAQTSIGTGSSVSNSPNFGFGAGLKLPTSIPATKPLFSFLAGTATTTVPITAATATAAAANLKPSPVQTTTNIIFATPTMTATPSVAAANLKPSPVQTVSSFIVTAPTTATTTTAAAAANVKPAPVQTAANYIFAAPAVTSTPIAQQISKLTTPLVVTQLQSTPVISQASVISSSLTSSVQNPEQMFGSSVTITKVPPAAVTSTQSVRVEAPTSDVKLPTHNQIKQATPPSAAAPAKPAVNNSIFYNAINEEIVHFDSELAAMRSRVNGLIVEVGSEDEKRTLCLKADAMDEFWRELNDTTQAQSSEIHGLKSVLMEAFAWVEEAKSRTQQLNCPMYIQLAQSQALDPVSARYTANIKHLVYYVENQLRQLNEQLDCRWLEFQDSCKPSVKNKMHIPSLESVYQAMVMQNNILNKQRAIMADIARRAQEQGRSTQIPLISSAVLARVREKEDAQLNKGESELSQLAESLVKMKLGPYDVQTSNGTGWRYRRLSRKKESVLRRVLSQRIVTRVCPTKPSRTTMGGISSGKPIVNRSDTVVVTMTPTSVAESYKVTSALSAGVAVTEPKRSPIINVTKFDSPQPPLFLFGSARSSGEHDASSKSFITKGFSSLGTKSGSPNKETVPGRSVATSSGIFAPTVESSTAKHNVLDSTLSGSHASDVKNKGITAGEPSFTIGLHSEKPAEPRNFSFGLGLNNVSSLGKLNDASKKLEDHYEDLSPPETPECLHGEAVSPTGSSVSSSLFTFNFTATPTTTKAGIVPASSNHKGLSPLLTTPIMYLNSIVAGIGDSDSAATPTTKPVVGNKSMEMSSANNATSGTAFSFGSLSLGQPQQGGSNLGKADEPRKSSNTFTFSLGSSQSSSVPTPSPLVISSGDMSQMTPSKSSAAMTTGVNLKTPLLTSLGSQNLESTSSPQVSIFGAAESQKPTPSFVSSGNTSVSSSSTNIFAQAATSVFGNLTAGLPSKQPVSLGNMFGATPISSGTTGKEGTDSTTSAAEPELQKTESAPKSQSFENENIFSPSSLQLGSLSIGSVASSKAVSPGSIFGGASDSLASNFAFGKQSASTESQNSIGVQNVPEPTVAAQSPDTQVQISESPAENTQGSASKPNTTPGFDQTAASPDENSKSLEGTDTQVVPDTSPLFGGAKTESTTAFTFGHLASSPSASQTSVIFGQTKPLTGSIFGAVVTPPATSQQTVAPLTSGAATTSPATQTPSSASTTFSFSLPNSAPSSSLFGQKTTSMFGQPVSSDASATTSSGSFFGQPICSPSGFGQSGGSVFGQAAATTAAKTNIFGQSTSTTTAPTVFGQGSTSAKPNVFGQTSTSFFGQPPATGSSFLSGGFGSKPTFGQSGGSIFGQSSTPGFGSSGTSLFGGSNVFGGSSSSTGSLFQSSSGGSIFGGSTSSGGNATGGGAFSSGLGQSIIQSGFGTPAAFQSKPGGFGGSPVFDRGTSGFGTSPTFGGAPTFGGSPTFGSPGKVFGSPPAAPPVAFGSAGQQSSTFESLASQNTMTFGNLAQNQSQGFGSPPQPIFGGNQPQQQATAPAFSSGSSTFGGSSFSSWR